MDAPRRMIVITVALLLVGGAIAFIAQRPMLPATASAQESEAISVEGIPTIDGITGWFNTPDEKSLIADDLTGKVVLIHFWTYGCYNCVNTIPSVHEWYEEFAGDDFVLIGVHTPEFDHEKQAENVAKFIADHDISYPVAMDNEFVTWNAFHNKWWPSDYLYDQTGKLIYSHAGEGDYNMMAEQIRAALR